MALGITQRTDSAGTTPVEGFGDLKVVALQIDFDASYPTGGETLDLSPWFRQVYGVVVAMKGGYYLEYVPGTDASDGKLKVRYADYDAAADGVLIEVPNLTDLSALTDVEILAWGI